MDGLPGGKHKNPASPFWEELKRANAHVKPPKPGEVQKSFRKIGICLALGALTIFYGNYIARNEMKANMLEYERKKKEKKELEFNTMLDA